MPFLRIAAALLATVLAAPGSLSGAGAATTERDRAVPHYDHVIVIVEENKGYRTILERDLAPNIARFAKEYGSATRMFAEVHPSEGNYVALLGGDTFGIHDDDAWYCVPGSTRAFCSHANEPGYAAHLIDAPNLGTQLRAKGLDWRAYLEDIPEDGSLAIMSTGTATRPPALYAAKHTGFTNFKSTIDDPARAQRLVGFDAWRRDLRSGSLPAFSLVVPNQCNEMHSIGASEGNAVPADCSDPLAVITRGDRVAGELIAAIQASPVWTRGNTAVVITWDEDGPADRVAGAPQSCCVVDAHNPGGGRIPTVVITNHGPRRVSDDTPYDHYSLLRTIEDALALGGHLRHTDDEAVLPMTPLLGPVAR
jgi:phosphatidylinositol-3-phosphatase